MKFPERSERIRKFRAAGANTRTLRQMSAPSRSRLGFFRGLIARVMHEFPSPGIRGLKNCGPIILACLLWGVWCGGLVAQIDIPPGKWWKNDPELVQALNLTSRQVEQIEAVFERYRNRLMDLQLEVRKKVIDLQDLLEADSLNESRVESQIAAMEQARSELVKERLMMIVKIRGQLTPEQWRTLRQTYAQRRPPAPPQFRPRQLRPGPGRPGLGRPPG